MTASAVRAALRVYGLVQGVGFRWATEREARRLGLRGYVRNREDSSVEIVAEGDPASIERLIQWAGHGPRAASVEPVDVARHPASGEFADFGIRG